LNSRDTYENLLYADGRAFEKALANSRSISWKNFGKKIRFYF